MSKPREITIVGGGLAGLALGIGLRRDEVPVTIWEAGGYPRHRVCGEFISGKGLDVLERLKLTGRISEVRLAKTAMFVSGRAKAPVRTLPHQARCVSRFVLDATLAREFQEMGGTLRAGERFKGDCGKEGVIRASGRRPHSAESGWRWFGVKIHAKNVSLEADLEMHVIGNGYVGICRLPGDEVNICGLLRSRAQEAEAGFHDRLSLLRGPETSWLNERLAKAVVDEDSFCAVAGLSLRRRKAANQPDCCIGDSLTMTPPVTGNGMSMALESAEAAVEPLLRYSRGETDWQSARSQIAAACDTAFERRLRWARWLQNLLFTPVAKTPISRVVFGSQLLWRMMFERTR
jgi:flavin-dependent dehydrogenase